MYHNDTSSIAGLINGGVMFDAAKHAAFEAARVVDYAARRLDNSQ